MNNNAIIILGMHRSGTSATTGMLRCLGVSLGPKLYAGHSHINAKGYFEHSNVADTNEETLLTINSAWDDILPKPKNWWNDEKLSHYANKIKTFLTKDFKHTALWAIKDPRVCRLMPWWLNILTDLNIKPKFLVVIRPPHEAYLSLNRRDGFSLEKSYLLWILHYIEAEFWSRKHTRTFVTFEALINNPTESFKSIETALGLCFPISPEDASSGLSQFISKDLVHHNKQKPDELTHQDLIEIANKLYELLAPETRVENTQLNFEELDKIRQQVQNIENSFSPLLTEQLRNTYKIRSNLQLTINKIFRSWSWFLGKPIRLLERLQGKDV